MNPSNIASTGLGMSGGGGIVGAIGSIFSGGAQQKMQNYQARVAQLNAQVAKQNADYAIQRGEQQAQSYGMQASQRQGQIKVAQAASGLDINSGSNLAVQQGQRQVTTMDLEQIRSNAAKTAYDYDVQSTSFTNQAQLDKMAGQNEYAAGWINAGSTLIGSASSVAERWYQGQQVGLTSGGTK